MYKVNRNMLNLNNEEFNYWVGKFVVEVKKRKLLVLGSRKNSLRAGSPSAEKPHTCTRYIIPVMLWNIETPKGKRQNGRPEINLFENGLFKHFQNSLDEMKRLTSMGIVATVKQAGPLSEDQGKKLWDMKFLGLIVHKCC